MMSNGGFFLFVSFLGNNAGSAFALWFLFWVLFLSLCLGLRRIGSVL